jgi:iron complex outermembrane receptor protein
MVADRAGQLRCCGISAGSAKKAPVRLPRAVVAGSVQGYNSATLLWRITVRRLQLGKIIAFTVASAALAPVVYAQDLMLEEILVTAQKREQTLEDVPAAVSAISGESVRDYLGGAQDIRALAARVPGLNIETSNGRTQPRFYLRGLGNIDFDVNANQPVAMILDEISLENNTLRSIPLFDVERIEVLKGPQGSLFGRNTNAGVIKVDSVKPSAERNGYFMAAYGSRNTLVTEAASNFPLSDTLIARVSLKYQERDKWIDNTVNGPGDDFGGFDEFGWRVQLAWDASESFSALLKLHGFNQNGSDPNVFYANAIEVGHAGLRHGFNEKVVTQDSGDVATMDTDHIGGALNLKWTFGNDMTFTSITGYDTLENFQSADVDGGEVTVDFADIGKLGKSLFAVLATGDGLDDLEQWTQEFRLAGQADDLFYQVGFFYFDEDFDLLNRSFNDPPSSAIVSQQTKSWAFFGQIEYALNDAWSVTAGGRWTDDEKDLQVGPGVPGGTVTPASISVSDNFFNWDVALTFDANEDWTWYGRVATGSRGPVTLGRFGFVSSAKTEDTLSTELGFKSTLLNGRARWNTSVYAFRNDDQQLTATGGAANVNQLLNADRVNGVGAETEFDLLVTKNLFLSANLSYNDTEIDDPNLRDDQCGSTPSCTGLDPVAGIRPGFFGPVTEVYIDGNPLPRTPKWIANIIAQYSYPLQNGEMYVNTDWNYRDKSNLFLHRSIEFVQEERWLGGLRVGYRTHNGMDFALVGRNITDEVVVEGGINFLNLTAFVNEPAYWGAEFRATF